MSKLADLINFELVKEAARKVGLSVPVPEHRFHVTRKWRFDYAWPGALIAVELEGGVYTAKVSHSSIGGILRDMEKGNAAVALGWRVFRLTPDQLKHGELVPLLIQLFGYAPP